MSDEEFIAKVKEQGSVQRKKEVLYKRSAYRIACVAACFIVILGIAIYSKKIHKEKEYGFDNSDMPITDELNKGLEEMVEESLHTGGVKENDNCNYIFCFSEAKLNDKKLSDALRRTVSKENELNIKFEDKKDEKCGMILGLSKQQYIIYDECKYLVYDNKVYKCDEELIKWIKEKIK